MTRIAHGGWALDVVDGALRTIRWRGIEVIRGIDCPVRDENWGTWPQESLAESWDPAAGVYSRAFRVGEGALEGLFSAAPDTSGRLTVTCVLAAHRVVYDPEAGQARWEASR